MRYLFPYVGCSDFGKASLDKLKGLNRVLLKSLCEDGQVAHHLGMSRQSLKRLLGAKS